MTAPGSSILAPDEARTPPEPQASANGDRAKGRAAAAGSGPLAKLAATDPRKAARQILQLCRDQDTRWAGRHAQWRLNALRRGGILGAYLRRDEDGRPDVYIPPGTVRVPPSFNKARRLCRKLVSTLLADDPVPECVPAVGATNDDPDAAEFATRILRDAMGASGLNGVKTTRQAVDRACTYGSGFVHLYVDPQGGGHRPKQIMASQAATTVDDATHTQAPVLDELGQPVLDELGQPMLEEVPQPEPYLERYVAVGGALTDNQEEAELEWLPELRHQILTGLQVRPVPRTAADIESAEGVLLEQFTTLGVLRRLSPTVAGLDDDETTKLVQYRPPNASELVAAGEQEPAPPTRPDPAEPWPDDTAVYALTLYLKESPLYPWGFHAIVGGPDTLAYSGEWSGEIAGMKKPLPLPVAQFKQHDDGETDFYGSGLMDTIGGGNEVRASLVGLAMEALVKHQQAKTFYTPDGLFQPKHGALLGTYVAVAAGTAPTEEKTREFPRIGAELLEMSTAELDDDAGLPPAAQGFKQAGVNSGIHQQSIVEQVGVALTDIHRNTTDGFVRLNWLVIQLIQAFYTVTQQIRVVGEDNEYKQRSFNASDFTSEMDVQIVKGSGTMLAPSAKAALAQEYFQAGALDRVDYINVLRGNLGGQLGVQDNPHLLRVRGQIAKWAEGPEGLDPAVLDLAGSPPPMMPDPMLAGQPPMVDPATGQPAPPPMVPVDPMAFQQYQQAAMQVAQLGGAIFDQRPVDVMPTLPTAAVAGQGAPDGGVDPVIPGVSMLRLRELMAAMSTTKYARQHPVWQQVFDAEFDRMLAASGVRPLVLPDGTPLAPPMPVGPDGQPLPPAEDGGAPSEGGPPA
jgi:hypothetical protein